MIYGRKSSDEISKIKACNAKIKTKIKDIVWLVFIVLFMLAVGLTFVIGGIVNLIDYLQGNSKDLGNTILSVGAILLGLIVLSIFIVGRLSAKLSHYWAEWVIWSLVVTMAVFFLYGLDIVITRPNEMWTSSGRSLPPAAWLVVGPAFIVALIWARKATLKQTGGKLTYTELLKKKDKNEKKKK